MAKVGYIQAKASLCSLSHIIDPHGISLFWLAIPLGDNKMDCTKVDSKQHFPQHGNFNPFKVDVYSYAIICFEILTRVIQFAKIHVSKIKAMIKASTRPTLPTSLPKFLLSLIE
jgi:hypothetical protein